MNDLYLQSEYADIILELLQEPYHINSVIKIVFLSFCIRNEKKTSYGNRKTNFVDTLMDNINIKLLSHPDELMYIFEVIDKLKRSGWIEIKEGKITLKKILENHLSENVFLKGCRHKPINPIIEVNKLDDKAFIEEVLRHV